MRQERMVAMKPGDPAPSFELPRAGGGSFGSSEMMGRVWLLSFQRYAT